MRPGWTHLVYALWPIAFMPGCQAFQSYRPLAVQAVDAEKAEFTAKGWRLMNGKFNIEGDVCEELRPNVLLYATTATVASGKVSQAITGPWNLGRPRGCPKSANGGKTLIPDDPEPGSRMTIASAVKKAQAKTKAAKKAKKSAKKAAKKTASKSARNARAKR